MRILLVDPSRVGLKVMSRLLEGRGHTVLPFQDGADALRCLTDDREIEVVLTSFELAGLSGLELCWEARALATSDQRTIYVVAMSSSHDQDKLVEALDSGADDFVLKPPNEQELSARLRAAERINKANRELIRLATRDPLTGLYNRRAFFERANRLSENASPVHPVGAIMFDIDYFKRVNDGFGHDVGDLVIQNIANLGQSIPGVVGRLGGEEFAIVIDGCDEMETRRYAEALRHAAARQKIDTGSVLVSVTISAGVAVTRKPETVDFVLKRSDVALYQAKSGGRNRVIVDGSNAPDPILRPEDSHIRLAKR